MACHNTLPTRVNLFQRKMVDTNRCPICERESESIIHALWKCPAAVDVWEENSNPLRKWSFKINDY